METQRLLEKLKAIAQTGKAYSKDPFDLERFDQLGEIAVELTTLLSGRGREEIEANWPIEKGYATPKLDVRAAVFKDSQVLLCKEKSDGRWTLPGGWADVGVSPAECAVKEAEEETGYEVRARKLVALYDRDKHEHPKMLLHTYKAFFLCDLIGGAPKTSIETTEIRFFEVDSLPELSTSRVTAKQILHCFEHFKNPGLPTSFD